jgi:hypothetical protein
MKTLTLTAVFCWSPLLIAADENGNKIGFADAKVGTLPKGWSIAKTGKGTGGDWKIVADKDAPGGLALAQLKADKSATFNLCVLDGPSHKDIDMQVSLKAIAGEVDQGGGLVWRLVDGDNYYIARINPLENNFRVYKVEKGKRTQLASAEINLSTGKWYALRIVHEGKHIECYCDGKKYLTAEDATFTTAGRIGFWTKADAQTRFADLTIAKR